MKRILSLLLLGLAGQVHGQEFHSKFEVTLPKSLQNASVRIFDMDNDGLLDIVAFNNDAIGRLYAAMWKTDTVAGPTYQASVQTDHANAVYLLTDWDGDNDVDILVSGLTAEGPRTTIYTNQRNFVFEAQPLIDTRAAAMAMGDLDEDHRPELLISGFDDEPFLPDL